MITGLHVTDVMRLDIMHEIAPMMMMMSEVMKAAVSNELIPY